MYQVNQGIVHSLLILVHCLVCTRRSTDTPSQHFPSMFHSIYEEVTYKSQQGANKQTNQQGFAQVLFCPEAIEEPPRDALARQQEVYEQEERERQPHAPVICQPLRPYYLQQIIKSLKGFEVFIYLRELGRASLSTLNLRDKHFQHLCI